MVSQRRIKSQTKYFYTPRWKAHDVAFIHSLAWQADHGYKQSIAASPDPFGLGFAMDVMNNFSKVKYGIEFYTARLDFLSQRFEAFERMLKDPTFDWNPRRNWIIGSKETWDKLFWDCPFAKAYWWRGERWYHQLRTIFEANGTERVCVSEEEREGTSSGKGDVLFLGFKDPDKEPHEVVDLASRETNED